MRLCRREDIDGASSGRHFNVASIFVGRVEEHLQPRDDVPSMRTDEGSLRLHDDGRLRQDRRDFGE
jgi:hypothetical protein